MEHQHPEPVDPQVWRALRSHLLAIPDGPCLCEPDCATVTPVPTPVPAITIDLRGPSPMEAAAERILRDHSDGGTAP